MSVDERRVDRLATALMQAMKDNFAEGPIHRDRVFETLNALAIAVAVTLHGADVEAAAFFTTALTQYMDPEWIEDFKRGIELN